MNFTGEFVPRTKPTEELEKLPEIKINPRFYGNQSLDNLLDLKLRVHYMLNTPKEKFNEQEVKKLEDDVQRTYAHSKFQHILNQFKSPSLTIDAIESERFTSFCYNETYKIFIMGFRNGYVGFGQIQNCYTPEKQTRFNKDKRYLGMHKKEADPGHPIDQMFIQGDDLYFLTERSLSYSKVMPDLKMTRPDLNKIYFSTFEKPKTRAKYFVQLDLKTGEVKETEIKLDATFFEVGHLDPEVFYFIEDKIIYKMDFLIRRSSTFGFFAQTKTSALDQGEKDLFGAEEFFRSKHMIDFVRFDKEMKTFFMNEGRIIKQIDVQNFEVLKIFEQQALDPQDLYFCPNLEFLYSFHFTGEVLVWNVEKERLICILKNSSQHKKISPPLILNHGKNVALLHHSGINLWQLESPSIGTKIKNKSSFTRIILLEDGEHLMMEFGKGDFYLMEVDTFRVIERFRLPLGTRMYRMLGDGDMLLVMKNRYYSPQFAHKHKQGFRKSMRHFGGTSYMRGVSAIKTKESKGLEEGLKDVLRNNQILGRKSTQMPQRSQNQVLEDSDVVLGNQEKSDPRLSGSNVFQLDPDEILKNIDDDDDIDMGARKVNNASYSVNTLTSATTLTPMMPEMDMHDNSLEQEIEKVKKKKNMKFLNIRNGDEVDREEVRPELFKYRLVRLVRERYLNSQGENKGLFTIFQTDHKIVDIDAVTASSFEITLSNSQMRLKRAFSKVKQKRSANLRQNQVVLVALENNQVYKVEYVTDSASKIQDDSIYINRMFQKMSNFKTEEAVVVGKSGTSSKANNKISMKQGNVGLDEIKETKEDNLAGTQEINLNPINFESNQPTDQTQDRTLKESSLKDGDVSQTKKKVDNFHLSSLSRKSVAIGKSEFRLKSRYKGKGNKSFGTMKLKYIPEDDLSLSSILNTRGSNSVELTLTMQRGETNYCEIKVMLDDLVIADDDDRFKIDIIKIPKKSTLRRTYKLYMYSNRVLATFDYTMWSNSLKFRKLFKKESASTVAVRCSPERRLFLVPINASVMVWDSTLTHLLFIFDTEHPVDETILLEDAGLLLIYDKLFYYELNLNEFRIRRKIRARTGGETPEFQLLLDFTLLPAFTEFSATFHSKGVHTLTSIPFTEELELRMFPWEDLSQSFLKKGYKRYVLAYADYYFDQLEQRDRKDFVYGPLNPLFFAVYHNDSNLLEDLLDKFFYPKLIKGYVSPLEYSFAMNYRTNIKVLCENLIKRNKHVNFSRADFKNLLRSDILSCHRLLATIPSEPELNILPRLIYMKSNVLTIFHDFQSSLMIHLKVKDVKFFAKDKKNKTKAKAKKELKIKKEKNKEKLERKRRMSSQVPRLDSTGSLAMIENMEEKSESAKMVKLMEREIDDTTRRYVMGTEQSKLFKSEVTLRTVPFKYNFDIGTEDSVAFVFNYSKSNSQDFVLSDWSEIIRWKWNRLKLPLISMMVLFYAYFLSFAFSTAIYPTNNSLRNFALAMNIILILLEIVQMMTFVFFHPPSYFMDWENFWDWIIYISTFLYLTAFQSSWDKRGVQIFLMFILIPLFFRAFLYLRILSTFTALVGMIQIIMTRLISFFLLLAYTYIGVFFLLMKIGKRCAEPEKCLTNDQVVQMVYYWIFLGSVEADDFDTPYTAMPIIFGSLFTTIILLNILIAFLSNEFSRLEEQQRVQELRERASLIMNFEVLVMFFKYKITRKIQLRRSFEKEKYQRMLRPIKESDLNLSPAQKKSAKRLKEYMRHEKFLYIFRKVDLESDFVEENLYYKVKLLEKMNEELGALVSKRSRAQEDQIQRVLQLVQANSKSQDKTVDDLKNLIGQNSSRLNDNTETLIVDIATQKKKIQNFTKKLRELENQLEKNTKSAQKLLDKS